MQYDSAEPTASMQTGIVTQCDMSLIVARRTPIFDHRLLSATHLQQSNKDSYNALAAGSLLQLYHINIIYKRNSPVSL